MGILLAGAALAVGAGFAAADGEVEPGAYCPLPREGERPRCMAPARQAYGEFFAALDGPDAVGDREAARVEAALAGADGSDAAYLALSSLAYGYYRLSLRAAQSSEADPAIAGRLERWNALLGQAYGASPEGTPFRAAVRQAALDLQQRAPAVRLRCVDARGEVAECDSTEAVVRGLDAAAADAGIRGGLERVLERILGPEGG